MTAARPSWPFVAMIALFVALVAASWIGFIGSDDVTYARGAYGWLETFPYVGGHGTIRYPITLPMALAFRTLGENEWAMVLPSLLYAIGVLILAARFLRRADGDEAAILALLLLATSPLFVIQGSIANVDAIELFFLFASFLMWWRALNDGPTPLRLIAAGALAGLAFLTRETAVFIAVFYGLLFLAGYGFARLRYLWIGLGFVAVWALELLYLGIMTGDPLYRFNIAMTHDSTIDRSIDVAGNVIVHPLIDPLLVLLANQEFMLLFPVAIPLALWLCFGRGIAPQRQRLARLLCLFALTWFVCVGTAQTLLPLNPRYFTITTAAMILVTGIGLAALWQRNRIATVVLAGALVATNLIGIIVENKAPMFAERTLAAFARAHPQVRLTTDPMTRYRADMLLKWAKAESRVGDTAPAAGGFHFYNPAHADRANARMAAAAVARYQPQPDWRAIAAFPRPIPFAARIIDAAGLRTVLPPSLWCKLRQCSPGVTFYLTGAPTRPSTIARNRLTPRSHVAASSISALPVFAQGSPAHGRKGDRL
ncbi:MAG: ArnT family glycosyltransferase [Sphingomonadaceae bacterium]